MPVSQRLRERRESVEGRRIQSRAPATYEHVAAAMTKRCIDARHIDAIPSSKRANRLARGSQEI